MTKTNDQRIMELRTKIETKQNEIGKKERFIPVTNCQIELDGVRHNIHTFDRKKSITLLVKLNSLLASAKVLGFEEEYEISGYKINEWIDDLKTKIRLLEKDIEQKKLDTLEAHLNKLLSKDKKVELEIDSIEDLLS